MAETQKVAGTLTVPIRAAAPSRPKPAAVVGPLTALWAVIAGGAVVAHLGTRGHALLRPGVPWLALAAFFVLTQAFVMNIQLRREARAVFLSELPSVLGLLYVGAPTFVLARCLGALVAFGAVRRQYRQPQKLAFNTALAAAEAGVAVLVVRALPDPSHSLSLLWLNASVGAATASAFTAMGVGAVIGLLESALRVTELVKLGITAWAQAVPIAALGVVVAAAWSADRWAAVPLGLSALLMIGSYRAYAQLRERHLALERLFRFSQVVAYAPGVDDVLRSILEQAREIMHAEQARITFLSGAEGPSHEVVLTRTGELERGPSIYVRSTPWLVRAVVDQQQPVLVMRDTRQPDHRAWLDHCGIRDSVMVPLHGEIGPIAVLGVDDRQGDARGFDEGEVRLLETVAHQAALALRNGELVDRLRHESLHDPLTGLPNREMFLQSLNEQLEVGKRLAVGIIDLDAFKEVNDTLGHQSGDELLIEVARRMHDTLDGAAILARLGGDEFAVLVPDCHSIPAAERWGLRLLRAFDAPVVVSGIEIAVSASLGLAISPDHGESASGLLKRADLAMYDAKHHGREMRVFDPVLDTSSPSKLALVAHLRQAIEAELLDVHFQPKVDARTGRCTGAEALARWTDASRGEIITTDFIALAERSGLIAPLTRFVLDTAVAACAEWQATSPGVGVAVNISVRSLGDDGLVRLVDRILYRHRLDASLLTLEITESHIMADPAGTLGILQALRARGVQLSVDDFGTGYSSLSYLRRLPVTELKVDRSFVHRMTEESEDEAIVSSIVQLARALTLRTVAEGVEDSRTATALRRLGLDQLQGWHVAQPMPLDEFRLWLAGPRPRLAADDDLARARGATG